MTFCQKPSKRQKNEALCHFEKSAATELGFFGKNLFGGSVDFWQGRHNRQLWAICEKKLKFRLLFSETHV